MEPVFFEMIWNLPRFSRRPGRCEFGRSTSLRPPSIDCRIGIKQKVHPVLDPTEIGFIVFVHRTVSPIRRRDPPGSPPSLTSVNKSSPERRDKDGRDRSDAISPSQIEENAEPIPNPVNLTQLSPSSYFDRRITRPCPSDGSETSATAVIQIRSYIVRQSAGFAANT
jgi:hypothetical protein